MPCTFYETYLQQSFFLILVQFQSALFKTCNRFIRIYLSFVLLTPFFSIEFIMPLLHIYI